MEIIDTRNVIVDENIKMGDVLEVINLEDHHHEYWIVGYNGEFVEEGEYSLVNLKTGVSLPLLFKDLKSAFEHYCLNCDIRVVDTKLHIVE